MKKHFSKRIAVVCLLLMLISGSTFSAVYAWTQHKAQQVNDLKAHTVQVSVVEETDGNLTVTPGATEQKKVAFQNTGTASTFLRVSFSESWNDGAVWLPNLEGYAIKNWAATWPPNSNMDWELKEDGWYYYKHVLKAGESTAEVISSVDFPDSLPQNYAEMEYKLSFAAEVVQLSDESTVNDAALTANFGRTAVISNGVYENGACTGGDIVWN